MHEKKRQQPAAFLIRFAPIATADGKAHHRAFDLRFTWWTPGSSLGSQRSVCRVSGCTTALGKILLIEEVPGNPGARAEHSFPVLIPALMAALKVCDFEEILWLYQPPSPEGADLSRIRRIGEDLYEAGGPASEFPLSLLDGLVHAGADGQEPQGLLGTVPEIS